ncbi:glycoside hydrolase family 57 protein [Candidatus Margulisiibacteriota bacterium]
MTKGYLAIVLHAHLPYVRHPEHDFFLEELWFYEAITETYIPLIDVFENLVNDGVDFRITMSLTPPLLSMFTDPLLQDRYVHHLDKLIDLAEKEVVRTTFQPEYQDTAKMYLYKFKQARHYFVNVYGKNLTNAFRKFQDLGKLEIITCGATHGFLPLMDVSKEAVQAQVKVAADNYQLHLGKRPNGIWMPECGYYPGHDEFLAKEGIRFFFTDSHGVLHANPRPKYGVFAPIYCKSGVACFGRDLESSKSVWSAEEGYPGNPVYRDFYRDIGFDLDFDYIKDYISPDGLRLATGIKYHTITGKKALHKEPYNQYKARDVAAAQAGNFMFNREKQVEHLYSLMGSKKPIIISPYDAELFGHWWYEGPMFLDFLFRKIHHDQDIIKTITPMEYLEENPVNQVSTPSFSSWGYKGYSEVWLEGSNDWIYRHLHKTAELMTELANTYPEPPNHLTHRSLNQAARELLLAQSSDWAFIMKTGTMVEYAVKRTTDHIERFTKLYDGIKNNSLDVNYLNDIEWKDNIFPEIDYRVYASN